MHGDKANVSKYCIFNGERKCPPKKKEKTKDKNISGKGKNKNIKVVA